MFGGKLMITVENFWQEGGFEYRGDKFRNPRAKQWDITEEQLYAQYISYINRIGDEDQVVENRKSFEKKLFDVIKEEIEKKQDVIEQQIKYDSYETIEEFIFSAMKVRNISYGELFNNFDYNGVDCRLSQVESYILAELDIYNRETSKFELSRDRYGTDEIKRAIQNLRFDKKVESIHNLRRSMTHNESCSEYTDSVISWIMEAYQVKGNLSFNVAMLKHWMWQVKRYIHDLTVKSPMFINIYGEAQETGKTQLVKQISRILEDYRIEMSLGDTVDDRKSRAWTENFIVIIDELRIGDMNVKELQAFNASLKHLLTSDDIHYRELNTHDFNKEKRKFSPIGSSNKPISKILHDPTGMRRFYEFEVTADSDKMAAYHRVEALIGFDIKSVWDGIDESLEDGYVTRDSDYGIMLSEIQDSYQPKTVLDYYLEDEDNYIGEPITKDDIIAKDIVKHDVLPDGVVSVYLVEFLKSLKIYAEDRGEDTRYIGNVDSIARKLGSRGFHVIENGSRSYIFYSVK
jgi:hypothetical protein